MNYDLKKPCANCPFRTDIAPYLTKGRVREIDQALVRGTFACHKTTGVEKDGEITVDSSEMQHCAGALILLEKTGRSSQMMRIVERLGGYDRTKLDMEAPVFGSFSEMVRAQQPRKRRTG